jgi:hypothetical protein
MQTWFFTEDAYPYLPDAETYRSIRVNLPNQIMTPKRAPICTICISICGVRRTNSGLKLW